MFLNIMPIFLNYPLNSYGGKKMTMIISLTTVIVAATIASIIAGFIPRLSINYVSILIGIVIALIGPLNHLVGPFSSEVFMYIVAPLVYFEGQSTQLNLVRQSVWRILGTAVVLVVVMAIISGTVLKLIGVPIALAFLMAALSTTTDATATDAVSEGLIVPRQEESLLKMESLFNDATGIILVGAAAVWVEKGTMNYQQTAAGFCMSAFGGIITGVIAALIMISFRRGLQLLNSTASNAQNVLFVITPFFIYFIAEQFHVSGIIAVVCAGLMQNSEGVNSRFLHPNQFHVGLHLMSLLRELLNNIVFIILGILFVRIIRADLLNQNNGWSWIEIGVTLYFVNLIVRFSYGYLIGLKKRGSLIFSLGGVRGAITLALVFTINEDVSNLQFQQIVLTEALVIILSMVVPSVIFPFILPHSISKRQVQQKIIYLKEKMVQQGMKAIEDIYLPDRVRDEVYYDLHDQKTGNTLRVFWRQWLHSSHYPDLSPAEKELEQRALLWAFQAEREYLDMVSQKENMAEYVYRLYNDVLLAESILIDPENQMK